MLNSARKPQACCHDRKSWQVTVWHHFPWQWLLTLPLSSTAACLSSNAKKQYRPYLGMFAKYSKRRRKQNFFLAKSSMSGWSWPLNVCNPWRTSNLNKCECLQIFCSCTVYPQLSVSVIEHPLVDPRTISVCLITKDPQREYKDLLEYHNIKFISRVVGVEKLKGKFKGFDARRLLLRENGLFLADKRVIPLLPKLLGKEWFKAKKCVLWNFTSIGHGFWLISWQTTYPRHFNEAGP